MIEVMIELMLALLGPEICKARAGVRQGAAVGAVEPLYRNVT